MEGRDEIRACLNGFLERYVSALMRHRDEMMERAMPPLPEELFALFERTGNRLQYEEVYFERRKFLAVYGMAAIIEKERGGVRLETADKLGEVLRDICGEACWALPAHVKREGNPGWRVTVDLFASETAEALAEIVYRVGGVLSQEVVRQVQNEVERRVFGPFFSSREPYGSWEHGTNNWNAVCAGSIGCACVYLLQEEPERLQKCLVRVCSALRYFLAGYGEDGACLEGLGYFTYGMTYYMGFLEAVYRYSRGRIDLAADMKLEAMATFQQKCYFEGGRSISFSDGSSRETFRLGLTCGLSKRFMKVGFPPIGKAAGFDGDTCYRFMALSQDYLWTKEYLSLLDDHWFSVEEYCGDGWHIVLPDAKWSVCRAENGVGMACKGGHNGEPHNHNDAGSFQYAAGEDVFLDDLGAGEYTKKYFSKARYRILCNSSLGHSVPIVNGRGQMAGKSYGARRFFADGEGVTRMSLERAYRKGDIAGIRRTFRFDAETGRLTVEDCFKPSEGTRSITENLITRLKPEIRGREIFLRGTGGRTCRIWVEGEGEAPYVLTCPHRNHEGGEETVYSVRWEVPVGDGAETRFTVEA